MPTPTILSSAEATTLFVETPKGVYLVVAGPNIVRVTKQTGAGEVLLLLTNVVGGQVTYRADFGKHGPANHPHDLAGLLTVIHAVGRGADLPDRRRHVLNLTEEWLAAEYRKATRAHA